MRVLSSTYGSRGDVEPMVGLAVRLWALGAEEVRVCAPLVPVGQPVRPMQHAAGLVAARFDTVAAVAEGCDALAAGGAMTAGVRL